jgi:1-aminocyclopropane-1-carboxylate synthase
MRFCQRHRIHLISDELYALSVFDTEDADAIPFTSVLSFDTTELIDPDYLHVLYGMSKVDSSHITKHSLIHF